MPSAARPFTESLVHETARAEMNARRQGTHSSLTRGEVSMTGAKAWRQKGTGRARVGALSVPHREGGGAAFGPKPRHYGFKINRKARRRALRDPLRGGRSARDGGTASGNGCTAAAGTTTGCVSTSHTASRTSSGCRWMIEKYSTTFPK